MEVALPLSPPSMGFDFNDARILPFLSAPSSPRRFGDLDHFSHWELHNIPAPNSPKKLPSFKQAAEDFAFDFSADSEKDSLPADQLFHGGRIRPLNGPSPLSPDGQNERGRRGRRSDRDLASSSSRRGTRSVSPYRVSQYPWEDQEDQFRQQNQTTAAAATGTVSSSSSTTTTTTTKSSSRKWRLRDLLLFRSASEGRAYGKSGGFFKRHESDHDVRSCNVVRSSDSFGSNPGKSARRKAGPAVSAHELHYKTNKAASEGLRKKTFLPYKQGILGRFAFSPALSR